MLLIVCWITLLWATVYRPSKIGTPATMASTANGVEIVLEILEFISGNRPVRISQSPNMSIPKFLVLKPLVRLILNSLASCAVRALFVDWRQICFDRLH